MPVENLVQPDAVRRASWDYAGGGADWIRESLLGRGARPWQLELAVPALAGAFALAATMPAPSEPLDE